MCLSAGRRDAGHSTNEANPQHDQETMAVPALLSLVLAAAPLAAQAADRKGIYAFGGIGATGIEGELSGKEKSVKQNDTVSNVQAGAGLSLEPAPGRGG